MLCVNVLFNICLRVCRLRAILFSSVWGSGFPSPVAVCRSLWHFLVCCLTFPVPRSAFVLSRSPFLVIRYPFAVVCRYLPFCVLRPPSACRFAPLVPRSTFPLLRVAASRSPFPVSRFPLSLRLSLVVVVCRVYRLLVCRLLVSVFRFAFVVCRLTADGCRLLVSVSRFPFRVCRCLLSCLSAPRLSFDGCRLLVSVFRFAFVVYRLPTGGCRLANCWFPFSVSRLSLSFIVCRLTVVICWFPFSVSRLSFVV